MLTIAVRWLAGPAGPGAEREHRWPTHPTGGGSIPYQETITHERVRGRPARKTCTPRAEAGSPGFVWTRTPQSSARPTSRWMTSTPCASPRTPRTGEAAARPFTGSPAPTCRPPTRPLPSLSPGCKIALDPGHLGGRWAQAGGTLVPDRKRPAGHGRRDDAPPSHACSRRRTARRHGRGTGGPSSAPVTNLPPRYGRRNSLEDARRQLAEQAASPSPESLLRRPGRRRNGSFSDASG